jgi:hypothetical protein
MDEPTMDSTSLWTLIETNLSHARKTLPESAGNHNELELACDMLEAYAKDSRVSQEFWFALRDAAAKMECQTA